MHVVRCFDNDDIVHVDGSVDPVRDIDIVNTELILADVEQCEKVIETQRKKTRTKDKVEGLKLEVLTKCLNELSNEMPIRSMVLSDIEWESIKEYQFLTSKKVIYVCNVSDEELTQENHHVTAVKEKVQSEDAEIIQLSASFEYEVSQLENEEKKEVLNEFGLTHSGLERLAKQSFKLLGLETFLTTG